MHARERVRVGIIGGGLMGREVALAIARWPTLLNHPVRPALSAVCDVDPVALSWFGAFDDVQLTTTDYREVLASDDVDVVYVAVRHDLHEKLYVDTVLAGKDFLGEKPFGISSKATELILKALSSHPDVFARCSSEMPFFPGAQAAFNMVAGGDLGQVISATSAFGHSSDLDTAKPINWKRQSKTCGYAGVMNDLGMHATHIPLRLGWLPVRDTFAVVQDLVHERPGPDGAMSPCDTPENATILAKVIATGSPFPLSVETKRIDPGQKNTWRFEAAGMAASVRFSTRYPKSLWIQEKRGSEQVWSEVETGSQSAFPTTTGGIFEFGFSDAVLQMWASFLAERAGQLGSRFGCATPSEALESHLFFERAVAASVLDSDGRGTPAR